MDADVSFFKCRVLPPHVAQDFHELLQEHFPEHDQVECHCCCYDCPGWTQDEEVISDEEIREIVTFHDYRSGRPLPVKGFYVTGEFPGIASGAQS